MAVPSEESIELVPVSPAGNVAALQDPTGNTRLYYQKADGSIWQIAMAGPFTTGVGFSDVQLVPASEALLGTPIITTPAGKDLTDVRPLYNYMCEERG